MLTSVLIKNFKTFSEVEIELGRRVVFVGPNNSGKTTALQALALWEMGLRKWNEKRQGSRAPEKRPGVTINRRDLVALPVPSANLLWRDLHVRRVIKRQTENIRVDILVTGVTEGRQWECGLEFDYANEESFYCRPLRQGGTIENPERMKIPPEASGYRIAFLPPMSGLAATEPKWERGRVNVLLGEGQTAQVLRNLCLEIYEKDNDHATWEKMVQQIKKMFGIIPSPPEYVSERGEIVMSYKDIRNITLDLSASGRGLQQTLLLLTYLYANPKTVLLLDEPDAHLEVLRQKQIYNLLSECAEESGSQLIAASHSEVLLNEAAQRDIVVAFVGNPHRIDDRGSQVLKSLKKIGFDQYVLSPCCQDEIKRLLG